MNRYLIHKTKFIRPIYLKIGDRVAITGSKAIDYKGTSPEVIELLPDGANVRFYQSRNLENTVVSYKYAFFNYEEMLKT